MDKFTNKLGKFDTRKYTDKTKNDIYNMIKENVTVNIDDNISYINGNADISLEGIEELTEVLYNYIQQERAKQEIITLESVKVNSLTGTLNIKTLNDRIDNLNENLK